MGDAARALGELHLPYATLVTHAFVMRYVTAVAFTATVCDVLNELPHEVARVWTRRGGLARTVYLANRYLPLLCLALQVYGTSALATGAAPSDLYCKTVLSLNITFGTLSLGVGNYLVLLKVWALWDHARWVVRATTAAWAAAYGTTMVLVALSLASLTQGTVSTAPFGFHFCAITHKPAMIRGIWASPLAFEVLVFALTVLNAMSRPRKQHVSLVRALRQDGLVFFITLFVLRVFNLAATVALPTSLTFVGWSVIWAANTITLGRLIMHWQAAIDAQALHSDSEEDVPVPDGAVLIRTHTTSSYARDSRYSVSK